MKRPQLGWVLLAVLTIARPTQAQMAESQGGHAAPTSPFLGSVPQGTATAEPIPLSLKDAVNRALQFNLGLLLQEQAVKRGARRPLARARATCCPTSTAAASPSRAGHQPRSLRLPAPSRIDHRPVQRLRRAAVLSQPVIDLARAQRRARGGAQRARRGAGVRDRARPRHAGRGQPLPAGRRRRQPHRRGARAAGDRAGALHPGVRPEAIRPRRRHRRAARPGPAAEPAPARDPAPRTNSRRPKLQLARAIGLPLGPVVHADRQDSFAPMAGHARAGARRRAYRLAADYLAARERVAAAEASLRAADGAALPDAARRRRLRRGRPDAFDARTRPTGWRRRSASRCSRAAGRTARRIAGERRAAARARPSSKTSAAASTSTSAARCSTCTPSAQQLEAAQTTVTLAGQELDAGARSVRRRRRRQHRGHPGAGIGRDRLGELHRRALRHTTWRRRRWRRRSARRRQSVTAFLGGSQ